MSKFSTISLFITLFAITKLNAQDFMPSTIYQLDARFSHHALVVEKSTHSLYLYENDNGMPKLIKTYQIATGKKRGDKLVQGDKKTPEGIYHFQVFHPSDYLINQYGQETGKIYGAGAFTLNYPNEIDKRSRKTGGGIWLHSTDDDSRVSKGLDSKGCVVAIDKDLKEISQYIDLSNTPTVIVQNHNFLSRETWDKNKKEISKLVETWMSSWQNKDFDNYINSYSQAEFFDRRKGNWNSYRNYKRAVFARKDQPVIEFRNISILSSDQDYVVVTLEQDYKSDVINDIGKKTLYLKQNDNYEWKIVAEIWNKLDSSIPVAFKPSMRFFSDQKKITINNAQEHNNDAESI